MSTPRTPKSFQDEVAKGLKRIYSTTPVETEWRAITNIKGLYCPRVDVAVGPFSTVRGGNCIAQYDKLMRSSYSFIETLVTYHRENVDQFRTDDKQIVAARQPIKFSLLKTLNQNARCLLAIEFENQVSRKHLLGGAVNAAALGRVGVVVGWKEEKVRALVRLQAYWDFLRAVGKNTFSANNLVILSPAQLEKAIEEFK